MTFGNINEFASWLATSGAFGVALSLIAEWLPGWQTLASRVKFFITLALALALGLASHALLNWVPSGVKDGLEPLFAVVMTAITVFLASQGTHFVARFFSPHAIEFELADDDDVILFTPEVEIDEQPTAPEG